MIVRTKENLKGTKGEIRTRSWSSWRFLHRDDVMGVTLTDAILEPGLDQVFWYKNHLESVYCIEGEGMLEDLETGRAYLIKPGTLYALDKHDRHSLNVKTRMRVICTFVPPLVGGEIHDVEGSYPADERTNMTIYETSHPSWEIESARSVTNDSTHDLPRLRSLSSPTSRQRSRSLAISKRSR